MKPTLISVIIPTFNCGPYIADAIDSVFRQGHAALDVIVVDDGSTDNTLAVCKRYGDRIRVVSQENRGASSARNVGIRMAKGSIIGLLDADDLWPDDHIAVMLPYLDEDQPYDLVRGRTHTVQLGDNAPEVPPEPAFEVALVGACLFRATIFETVGLFDESMRLGEDFDWNVRIGECACREKQVDNITLIYRRRADSTCCSPETKKRGLIDVVRRKVARAKKTEGAAK